MLELRTLSTGWQEIGGVVPVLRRQKIVPLFSVYEPYPWQHPGRPPETAASDLRAILESGGVSPWSIVQQIRAVREWGERLGNIVERDSISLSGQRPGMEHEVIFDHLKQTVIKITLPGLYGNTLRHRDGAAGLAPATPLEYLDRWALSNELFEDESQVLGLVQSDAGPRIAVAQPLVVGQRPEREEIGDFMKSLGFTRVRDTHLFFDLSRELLVGDAHPGNFLRNGDGQIFAIDVLPVKASGKLLAYALGF